MILSTLRSLIVLALLCFSGSALIISCTSNEEEDEYIARVYDKYLTQAMLAKQIPATASQDDSLKRAKVYVNSWIKEQVVLHRAKFNLKEDDDKFQSKIEAYLNDLMIFEYEQQLVDQNLDTSVALEDMLRFYEENKQNFILKDYVVKMRYLIAPEDTEDLEKISSKFRDYDEQDSLDIVHFVETNGLTYRDKSDEWVFVPNLLEIIPINFTYFEEKVKQKKYFDKTMNGRRFLLYVTEFKVRDSETPFELEKERIRSIIINTRKQELLLSMRNRLFQDALESAQIEIRE